MRRFRRNRRGSAAVEFALVAPVFFALLFAIIETAIMFFASQVLETVTQNSARMILTGQAQTAGYTQAQFKTYVCSQIPALFTCANIYVDVQSYPAFTQRQPSTARSTPASNFVNNMHYSPGGPGDIVVVQAVLSMAAVRHRAWLQHLEFVAAASGCWSATAAFRNEPY